MSGKTAVREAAPEAPEVVVISRLFDAPRALVWEAWSSHAQLARWWGPMASRRRAVASSCAPEGRSRS
jgi:uncharacterized protein YndB with AHSA1/START domain